MRVRIIVPVAFNGTHRVYEGEEYDIPNDTPLASWMERIDDAPAQVKKSAGRSKAVLRAADEPVG